MRLKALLGLCLVVFSFFPAEANFTPKRNVKIEQPSNKGVIKVLLKKDIEAANLEVRGSYKIYDPRTGDKVAKGFMNKQYLLRPTLDGLAWGEQFPGVYQLALVPTSDDTTVLVDGIQYSGDLYVYQIGNTLSLVNVIDIEDFVKAMLNPNVNAKLHPEVLASLAIVARTQAYFYSTKNEGAFWHLDAQKIGYQGACVCSRANGVDQAVDLTHHLVMKSHKHGNGESFFDATFTENCAGKTAPYHVIFRKEGFSAHKGVTSPLAQATRAEYSWGFTLSKETLCERLGLEDFKSYELLKDPTSGKSYGMRFISDETTKSLNFFDLQSSLGDSYLKSSDFIVEDLGESVRFSGFGLGAGTGLCLYSAQEMAARNKNAADILEAFFPEMKITYMDVQK